MPIADTAAAARRAERHAVALPLLPLPRAGFFDPVRAGQLAKRGRTLLRAGEITHRELALLDCLLWSCRRPGQDLAVASYTALCKLAHVAKDTVSSGLAKLESLGLIERIKRRVRLNWHQGGQASRQATSCYRLVPPPEPDAKGQELRPGASATGTAHTESSGRTVNKEIEVFYQERAASSDAETARKALATIRGQRQPLLNTLLRRGKPSR